MTWILKHKIAIAIGVLVFLMYRKAKAGTAPAVAGTVSSGSAFGTFDTNVLSPTFGEPMPDPNGGWFW